LNALQNIFRSLYLLYNILLMIMIGYELTNWTIYAIIYWDRMFIRNKRVSQISIYTNVRKINIAIDDIRISYRYEIVFATRKWIALVKPYQVFSFNYVISNETCLTYLETRCSSDNWLIAWDLIGCIYRSVCIVHIYTGC